MLGAQSNWRGRWLAAGIMKHGPSEKPTPSPPELAADRFVPAGHVLTVADAAELLRVGRNKLYELVSENKIPHRRLGRAIRFSRAALLAWLANTDCAIVGPWSSRSQEGQP